jgi:7-cyano-7-deazaguanine synthase in queuosine biosynthesis
MKPLLLFGGGLESSFLLYHLVEHGISFDALHVDYGQKAADQELHAVATQCARLNIRVKVKTTDIIRELQSEPTLLLDGQGQPFVRARNAALCLVALAMTDYVYIGSYARDPVPDASLEFYQAMERVAEASFNRPSKIDVISGQITQHQMAQYCVMKNPRFFDEVFSCWVPVNGKPCGQCKHCEKITALRASV